MDIFYQYYNEIVLAFGDYEVDLQNGIIVILVPDDRKSFDVVCQKINVQLSRIAETLELRNKPIIVRVERSGEAKELVLEKQEG
jgi:hypothetical protein